MSIKYLARPNNNNNRKRGHNVFFTDNLILSTLTPVISIKRD